MELTCYDIVSMTYKSLRVAKTPEHIIYAYLKTGRILTEITYNSLPEVLKEEWDAAIMEYHYLAIKKQDILWDDLILELANDEKKLLAQTRETSKKLKK